MFRCEEDDCGNITIMDDEGQTVLISGVFHAVRLADMIAKANGRQSIDLDQIKMQRYRKSKGEEPCK